MAFDDPYDLEDNGDPELALYLTEVKAYGPHEAMERARERNRLKQETNGSQATWTSNGKYPWPTWDDGQWHILKRGEDFDVPLPVFQVQVHRYAGRKDKVSATRKIDDTTLQIGIFRDRETMQRAKAGSSEK
jgi:hypothetical protein